MHVLFGFRRDVFVGQMHWLVLEMLNVLSGQPQEDPLFRGCRVPAHWVQMLGFWHCVQEVMLQAMQ